MFRPDYLGALRRLSRKGDPEPLVAAMARLWDFGRLVASNAFRDDDTAILRFYVGVLPRGGDLTPPREAVVGLHPPVCCATDRDNFRPWGNIEAPWNS